MVSAFALRLARETPMPVAHWMARVLGDPRHGYYITRDPLGAAGDFTTAPEISQMFGELIGAWMADLWLRSGSPQARLVELGPGRGTLMADLLRAVRSTGLADLPVHFVETSPVLRGAQAARVPHAHWHDALTDVPDDLPLLLVANEFFDALPVRQFVRLPEGWRERMVVHDGTRFVAAAGAISVDALVPPALWNAPAGSICEASPASTAMAAEIGARLIASGGAALITDYGYVGPALGDTLQALRHHQFADPFDTPGEADLTAHVDFAALAAAGGARAWGPVGQGAFLGALGIDARAAALKARAADPSAIDAARTRLTETMGTLFKALALTGPGWPQPAGFA
jgi:NADH dehydrogenase [ubiquinone] 1 alpha subcomplex assembly factor 7